MGYKYKEEFLKHRTCILGLVFIAFGVTLLFLCPYHQLVCTVDGCTLDYTAGPERDMVGSALWKLSGKLAKTICVHKTLYFTYERSKLLPYIFLFRILQQQQPLLQQQLQQLQQLVEPQV